MPCSGREARAAIFDRGHQLWPQVSPRAGVSLAIWHKLTARPCIRIRLLNPLSSREASPLANFRNSPLANFQRSAFVQPEVEELQSRIGQGGNSGFVQTKLVRAVLCTIKPFRSETVSKGTAQVPGDDPPRSARFLFSVCRSVKKGRRVSLSGSSDVPIRYLVY